MKTHARLLTYGSTLLLAGLVLIAFCSAASAADPVQNVDYEAGFYYTVQKGDTLWDLSQHFSDSPWQWPDLWQENKQIPNPHWIYPGERIRLFRKADQARIETPAQNPVPPIAPAVQVSVPVEKPKIPVDYIYANIDRVGFIRKPAVQPLGVIVKSLDNKTLISEGDTVYVRYPDGGKLTEFAPGMRLTVYRALNPTEERNSQDRIGTQHYLLGIVEITKPYADYAMARVTETYRAIELGDLVMMYDARKPEIPVVDSTPGINGQIIATEDHTKLIGDLNIAFIDKGLADKVVPGQVYAIYYQESAPAGPGGQTIQLDPVNVGSLLVLLAEQTTSTVVITDSSRKIVPGQPIHTP